MLPEKTDMPAGKTLTQDLQRLLLIVLPLFLLFIGWRPLSVPDEGRYPEVALEMLLSGDFITPRINGIVFLDKPALYYWLQALSFHVFGVSQWSIRLMPALFGVLGVAIIFITAWQLFSRRAAWWSAAILATNPLYFLAAQYADMNLEIAVLVTAALCLFLLGRREPAGSRQRRYLFWLGWMAIGFGVLTKGLIGFVFPAMVAGCWTIIGWRWRELPRWYFISGFIIVLAVCWPWFVAVQKQNPQFFHYFFIYQQFQRFSGTGFNNELPFWFYLPVIAGGLLPWSLWLPKALFNQYRCAFGNTAFADADVRQWLLLWPLLILVFFSLPASKIVGYILPVLPPLALLMGDYLDRKSALAAPLSFAMRHTKYLPVIGLLVSLALLAIIPRFEPNGIKPLATVLQKAFQAGDSIISYRNYYQDLPLYLHREKPFQPMTVVDNWNDPEIMKEDNWRREFFLGLQNQPEARNWLIDENAFAARLQSSARIFVLSSYRNEQTLVSRYGLHVIARTKKNILLATPAIELPATTR
ncbi:MAG TPA: glycosyltransferase family 39 protein [Pseudomonadales bacterium]|nr:glycosyltransferase family 39 protein [Pseudomonadales bacterium]